MLMKKNSCRFIAQRNLELAIIAPSSASNFVLRTFVASKSASSDFSADIKNNNEKNAACSVNYIVASSSYRLSFMGLVEDGKNPEGSSERKGLLSE
jgi:hypothetical protein